MEIKQYIPGMENKIISYGGHIGGINPLYRDPCKVRKAGEIQEEENKREERKVEAVEQTNSIKFARDIVRERITGGNIDIIV